MHPVTNNCSGMKMAAEMGDLRQRRRRPSKKAKIPTCVAVPADPVALNRTAKMTV